ncbi:MAG: hypothetical protein WBA74_21900, partial [Cyclobacteriaceae bacterium]
TVTMTLFGDNGCPTVVTRDVMVEQRPTAAFETQNLYCEDLTYSFESSSQNATSFKWKILETNDSSFQNVFTRAFPDPGIFTIELTAYADPGQSGCFDITQRQIAINANPEAAFEFFEEKVCEDSIVTIINSSVGANTFRWTLYDVNGNPLRDLGSSSGNTPFTFQEPLAGNYLVSVEAISIAGCVDSTARSLDVVANPQIVVDSLLSFICRGIDFNILNKTEIPNAETGLWNWFANGIPAGNEYQLPAIFSRASRIVGRDTSILFRLEATNDICTDAWEKRYNIPGYFGCEYVVPTAFSPNRGSLNNEFGDGFNDYFRPVFNPADTANIEEVEMNIFTQNELLIHKVVLKRSDGPGSAMICTGSENICKNLDPANWTESVAWDGTYNDQIVEDNRGNYYYVLRVRCCDEEPQTKSGNIQLVR